MIKEITIFFLFLSSIVSSQVDRQSYLNIQNIRTLDVAAETTALGSPFVKEQFATAKLNGFKDKVFSARYNAYLDELQIKTETKTIALDPEADYKVLFLDDNKVYQTFTYTSKSGKKTRGFLVVLNETTSTKLLIKETVSFQEKKPARNSYEKDKPATFTRQKNDYYVMFDKTITYLPTRKKDILKKFPDKSNAIKHFLKAQNISLNEEGDLIKLVAYISSL